MSMDNFVDLKATLNARKRLKIEIKLFDSDSILEGYITERKPTFYLYLGK